MNHCELSIAGKTFIAGEYLALLGEPALVLATEPRFRLIISEEKSETSPFHPQSPAGKYWALNSEVFSNYSFEFVDPYQIGGFGASSAQFALLQAFYQIKDVAFQETERFFDWHEMLKAYREISVVDGIGPSGADVVGAASGMITWFHRNTGHLQAFAWPFMEYEFFVAHTGVKLPTHEHLLNLKLDGFLELAPLMQPIQDGLKEVNFEKFISGLNSWKNALLEKNLCAVNTLGILNKLAKNEKILFAKGCGAMGSDVVFVICEKCFAEEVRLNLHKQGLKVVADSSQMAAGLQIKSYHSREMQL